MKYCSKCGREHYDDAITCMGCGAFFVVPEKKPMKWFKFLTRFLLIANAVLFFITGVSTIITALSSFDIFSEIFGYGYSFRSEYLEATMPVNIVYGLVVIGLGIFAIITRNKLSGYKESGPTCFYALYALTFAVFVAYDAVSYVVAQSVSRTSNLPAPETFTLGKFATYLVAALVIIVLHYIYFKKRKSVFCK